MATGPEHYRKAETLLRVIQELLDEDGQDEAAGVEAWAAIAQVHATLAFAAATAFAADMTAGEWPGWLEVAGSEETRKDAQ